MATAGFEAIEAALPGLLAQFWDDLEDLLDLVCSGAWQGDSLNRCVSEALDDLRRRLGELVRQAAPHAGTDGSAGLRAAALCEFGAGLLRQLDEARLDDGFDLGCAPAMALVQHRIFEEAGRLSMLL